MNRDTRRTRVLLALLLLTSISLITIDYRGGDGSPLDGVRSAAAAVFGPVEQVAAAIASPVSDAVDSVGDLGDGAGRGRPAEAAEPGAAQQAAHRRAGPQPGRRSSTTCSSWPAPGATAIVPARVIAIGAAQTFSWTVTLDAGSRDGLRPDMTVLNGDGLVGRVKTVGPVDRHRAARGRPGVVGRRAARGVDGGRLHDRPGRPGPRRPRPAAARRPVQRERAATGWSPSARRATRPTCPGCRSAAWSSVSGTPGLADPAPRWSRRTSTSPRWTWSASSSSRRARTRATPSCRRGRPPRRRRRRRHGDRRPRADGADRAPCPGAARRRCWSSSPSRCRSRPQSRLPLPGATPDLLLLVVVALALAYGPGFGLVCGFGAGLAADLVPPADHEVGPVGAGPDAGRLPRRRWPADETRRSAFVPLVVVARRRQRRRSCCTPALGALMDDPNITWGAVRRAAARPPLLYDVVLSAFVVPASSRGRRVEPDRGLRVTPAGAVAMSERSRLRLVVLQVLVLSLLVTLLGRLWYLQVAGVGELQARRPPRTAPAQIVTPAARGHDPRRPRPAAGPQPHRAGRLDQPDRDAAAARRRPRAGRQGRQGHRRAVRRTCGTRPGSAARDGAPPAPRCFNGSPYQPIPVTDEASTAMALQIMERREDFPGVTAELSVGARVPAAARRQRGARARLPRPGHRRGAQGRAQARATRAARATRPSCSAPT